MKNITDNENKIEHVLRSFKPNESVSLSLSEKGDILKSVFDRVESKVSHKAVKSPFYNSKTYVLQYARYSVPLLLLAVISTQAAGVFANRSKIAISDINEVKQTLSDLKRDNSIKSNLSKNKQDIQEIKLNLASANAVDNTAKTQILADQVSSRSKEIRNQVAALVSEDKITEAKKIALDLESALKADELYKVSTSVQQEVFSAIDLRVAIENKEYTKISSTTESDVKKKIETAKKSISTFEANASTSDMIEDASKSIVTAESYLNKGELENAIISLQSHDRIVADLKIILLP